MSLRAAAARAITSTALVVCVFTPTLAAQQRTVGNVLEIPADMQHISCTTLPPNELELPGAAKHFTVHFEDLLGGARDLDIAYDSAGAPLELGDKASAPDSSTDAVVTFARIFFNLRGHPTGTVMRATADERLAMASLSPAASDSITHRLSHPLDSTQIAQARALGRWLSTMPCARNRPKDKRTSGAQS